MNFNVSQLMGIASGHVSLFDEAGRAIELVPEVYDDWLQLKYAANEAGFEPFIVSAYRDYDRQAAIWEAKSNGQRRVLDDFDNTVDMASLSDFEKVCAIMRFSALPGGSRHHWGTDFDIADRASLPKEYQLQLTPSECAAGGVMAEFYDWLDTYLAQPDADFYRPYAIDRGGVSVEPWHLSHRRLASQCEQLLTEQDLYTVVNQSGLSLASVVCENFATIYRRFIHVES